MSGTLTIGRSKSNPIFIDDKMLSREHTKLWFDGRRYFVEDLESKNGTYLNGELVRKAEALKNGDVIKIRNYVFRFELDANETAPVGAPPPPEPAPSAPLPLQKPLRQVRPGVTTAVEEPSGAASFLLWIVLLPVFAGATFVFKIAFAWAFDRLPR